MPWRSVRRICGVSKAYQVRNEKLHRISDTSEDIAVRVKKNMLSGFCHAERMSDEKLKKKDF